VLARNRERPRFHLPSASGIYYAVNPADSSGTRGAKGTDPGDRNLHGNPANDSVLKVRKPETPLSAYQGPAAVPLKRHLHPFDGEHEEISRKAGP